MLREWMRPKHHAPATLQEEKAQGRIDPHRLVLARVGPLIGSKARKSKSTTSSTDIRELNMT